MDTDKLFELAFNYRKTNLWKSLFEDQLFAIELSGGRIGYVSITGRLGEHIAVVLYIGEEGLRSYFTLIDGKLSAVSNTEYNPAIVNNSCLQAAFDNKEYLNPAEYAAAKDYAGRNGIRISGKNAYPHFWKLEAGYYPSTITDLTDIGDLCIAIQTALALSKGPIVNGFDYHDFDIISKNSRYVPLIRCNGEGCSMTMTDLPKVEEYKIPEGGKYDELAAARLKKLPRQDVLQAGLVIIPTPVEWEKDGSVIFPTCLCIVDDESGLALHVQPVALYEKRTHVMLNKFMESLSEAGFVPSHIKVSDDYTEALLRKWCSDMGIGLSHEKRLPELEDFKSAYIGHFSREIDDEDDIVSDQAEMSYMLDELLNASSAELAMLGDAFGASIAMLIGDLGKHPELPPDLRNKIELLMDRIEETQNKPLNGRGRNASGKIGSSGGSTGSGRRTSSGKKLEKAIGKAAGKKGKSRKKSNGRHKERTYVISVSLGKGLYRHIRLADTESLSNFAEIILQAFEFCNDHLHAFFMDDRVWSDADAYFCGDTQDPYEKTTEKTPLYKAVSDVGHKFKFLFDYGDEWIFQCRLLRIEDGPAGAPTIVRSKGEPIPQYPDDEDEEWEDMILWETLEEMYGDEDE